MLLAALFIVGCLSAISAAASAGEDDWGCLSSFGGFCASPYLHHEVHVFALYTGEGNLPLLAGSFCEEGGCGGWLFTSETGRNGNGYNQVLACIEYRYCLTASSHLGRGNVENLHTSRHNILGSDLW